MSKIVLMTDSASDISVENEKKYGIKVICFQHAFGDNTYVSRVDFDNNKYYEMLDNFSGIPTTSQVTPFQFQDIYEEEYHNGCTDLIYVSINAKGSATCNNAIMAKDMFYDDCPEAKDVMNIHVIDGRSYTGAYGYAVVEGAKMLQNGASVQEVVDYITDWCEHCEIYFCMYTLKYAAKSGRINGATAFLGNALGIKPLMYISNGSINDAAKIRGEKNMVKSVVDHTIKAMKPNTPYCIVYGSNVEAADEMENAMINKVGYPAADRYQIGAEIAANAGPCVIGVIFYKD